MGGAGEDKIDAKIALNKIIEKGSAELGKKLKFPHTVLR